MENLLKSELKTTVLKLLGGSRGGYICQGQGYETDGGRVFVKSHNKPQARIMFEGEMASLREIQKTNTVRVPQPIKVMDFPGGGAAFAMEFIKMRSLNKYSAKLGEQMADLHLYNKENGEKLRKKEQTIGPIARVPVPLLGFWRTCMHNDKMAFVHAAVPETGRASLRFPGLSIFILQVNEWQNDWPTFFIRHRLQAQMDLIERDYGDRTARELWEQLKPKVPEMFHDLEIIPALVHGDLWSGNVAEDDYGPIVFDPSCFYGHSEFELAISMMFGGFSSSFFSAYHSKIPKAPGFEKRNTLYMLFNYINHWNHFGTEFRRPSLAVMQSLLK
ncbi:PREDICTED: fructosamine-3-kinase-like [Thamnophis sirtalis]|uniref:protein-ribulosamine 3-kinase n=1 Tax=Thamnophis sirtalis TaxID=35019 RepID=A0A6I9XMF4_9SAUR|nr:PREDICTED: fructosamine-3-kinase-like [Thamnophis sirtalis]